MPDAPKSDLPKPKSDGSFRWWEFYAVRYAMGTIVGGIVFYVLFSSNALLKPLATNIRYLAAFGLVYCYVASAPILVFHAGRFLLQTSRCSLWCSFGGTALIGFIGGIVVCYLVPRQHTPGTIFALFLSAVAIGVFILCLQGLVICAALRQGDRLWSFYEKLSDHRENANKGEIVDSYRHLREHGNSFFIVFLEITLGIILVGTSAAAGLFDTASPPDGLDGRFVYPLLVIITWILPAVFVWLIATQFERKFIDAPPQELPD